jgi:3-hydroxybutyryl-CoA dehydrogenase
MNNRRKIAVCGAGTMGAGIAQVFAQHNYDVLLFDLNENLTQKAIEGIKKNLGVAVEKGKLKAEEKDNTLARIKTSSTLPEVVADFIIEAIVEKLEVKQDLFAKLAANNSNETIFATNTSSIAITRIAKEIPNPGRVVGMHFFNPAHLMKLVEIIAGAETSIETVNAVQELTKSIGKTPALCKDSPGFIVNRVARHYYVESLKILEENAGTVENIDALLESAGFKMGPFKLMDTIGNDINFAVTSSLFESCHQDAKFRPSRIQQQKVDAGHLGKKTGKGFYNY